MPLPRLRLRPGVPVLPREPGVVQVGIDPPRRALLPDVPPVRRLVVALAHGADVDPAGRAASCPSARALDLLRRADLLVPAADLADVDPALLARHGSAARPRAEARAVAALHLDVAPALLGHVQRLVGDTGLGLAAPDDDPGVALVVADRWLDRARLDRWVRDGVPHLVVEARDGGVVVGPLVVPGATACLRCVDAHLGEQDPLRPLLLDRAAQRPDPSPVDRLATDLALAWAVRDVVRLVDGEHPATWSATVEVDTAGSGDADGDLVPRAWTRHPCCGCGWDVRLAV